MTWVKLFILPTQKLLFFSSNGELCKPHDLEATFRSSETLEDEEHISKSTPEEEVPVLVSWEKALEFAAAVMASSAKVQNEATPDEDSMSVAILQLSNQVETSLQQPEATFAATRPYPETFSSGSILNT